MLRFTDRNLSPNVTSTSFNRSFQLALGILSSETWIRCRLYLLVIWIISRLSVSMENSYEEHTKNIFPLLCILPTLLKIAMNFLKRRNTDGINGIPMESKRRNTDGIRNQNSCNTPESALRVTCSRQNGHVRHVTDRRQRLPAETISSYLSQVLELL